MVTYLALMKIKCDAKGCHTAGYATVDIARGGTFHELLAAEMQAKLYLQGWRIRGKKNLCWLCAKEKSTAR